MMLVEDKDKKLKADIRIVGVGGGGCNALQTMIKASIKGVTFIAVNTDAQALSSCSAKVKIQLGEKLTKGLGAGANPEIGRRAAMESYEEIISKLKGADMVFVTAGMGGGTGSGGAPIVAEAAKELGALVVGIVTSPFLFEGRRRKQYADTAIFELKKYVDTLITIPNEKLFTISGQSVSLLQGFKKTDEVLLQAVQGIAELVSVQGLINLDFSDVKTVMSNKGMALMSVGTARGKKRAIDAVTQAISSPLLDDVFIEGSKGMIVNIRSGKDLSLLEVNQATSCLTKVADPDADIIVGAVIDDSMGEDLSVTLIATGFKNQGTRSLHESLKEKAAAFDKSSRLENSEEESLEEENLTSQNNNFETEDSPQPEEPTKQVKMSLKDKLLLKAKEYEQKNLMKKEETAVDHQMSIDWEKNNSHQEETIQSDSPFESSIDFLNEDIDIDQA